MKKLMTILAAVLLLAMGTQYAQAGFSAIPSDTHWKCYRAVGNAPSPTKSVKLEDQFESTTETVRRPKLICNPVDKNGEGTANTDVHLTCYETVTPVRLNPAPRVRVANQFFDLGQTLTVVDNLPLGLVSPLPLVEFPPSLPNLLGGTHLLCVPGPKSCINNLGQPILCPNEIPY